MEDFFDNIVKHNCQKIFPPDCTEVFIVEKPRRGRNFARFSPLAFAAQNFRGRSSRSPLTRPLRKKTQPLSDCVFSSGGMGFASNWTALRLPYRVFALQKSRSPLTFPRHKKRNPYRIAFFFKWRDGLRVELDCAALALSGFCVAKIPFASHLSAPQKTQPYRIAFFSSGGMDETRTRDLLRDRQSNSQ